MITLESSPDQIAAPSEQLHRLDAKFAESISGLHARLEILLRCEPFTFAMKPRRLPLSAVYLFTEDASPLLRRAFQPFAPAAWKPLPTKLASQSISVRVQVGPRGGWFNDGLIYGAEHPRGPHDERGLC
jgi:hypothetical protein